MDGRRQHLVDRFARYGSVCEVGIGSRPGVARELAARGVTVTATDVIERETPAGVRFVRDDCVAASRRDEPGEAYRAELVYACNCPPELHRPLVAVGRRVGAAVRFTTLGGDPPALPVERTVLGDGVVVYRPRSRGPSDDRESQ